MKMQVGEQGVIEFEDVFNPIVVKTEKGRYSICERDGNIEVVKDGKIVFSGNDEVKGAS